MHLTATHLHAEQIVVDVFHLQFTAGEHDDTLHFTLLEEMAHDTHFLVLVANVGHLMNLQPVC